MVTTSKKLKEVKENITEKEYRKLVSYVKGNENYKEYKKLNLLRTFCILYYSGLRVNEVRDLKYSHIYELLEEGQTIIISSKTNIEKKIYLTESFKKELIKLFAILKDKNELIIYNNRKKISRSSNIAFINLINKTIKEILGKRYSSHSFRRGLITEMGSRGINIKIISKFIGHSDVKTTMRYIQPSDEDIIKCLIR